MTRRTTSLSPAEAGVPFGEATPRRHRLPSEVMAEAATGGDYAKPDLAPLLVTPEAAARMLAVSRSTIYVLMAQQLLPSVTLNRCRRIPVEALRAWVAAQLG